MIVRSPKEFYFENSFPINVKFLHACAKCHGHDTQNQATLPTYESVTGNDISASFGAVGEGRFREIKKNSHKQLPVNSLRSKTHGRLSESAAQCSHPAAQSQ